MKNKGLGSILLLNLVLNTKGLSGLYDMLEEERGETTMFTNIPARDLYPRLMSDIDFDALSEQDKTRFLFLRPEKAPFVDKKELHDYEMQQFAREAHNRTSTALGVKNTNVVFCNFSENRMMNPLDWVLYDSVNDNIYVNLDKDYSIARPTYLMENINAATRHHSIYRNIFKAMSDPDSLSDREYFLAFSTAVKAYVYQDLRENDPEAYRTQLAADYSTPSNIEEVIYGFAKTREDFQAAGLYGGELRDALRRNEETYYDFLENKLLTNSLVNMEDIFAYFVQSPLNQSSDGLLGGILRTLEKQYTASFYDSLGADMKIGQSISDYVDELEEDMFDRYGITPPTDEELEEFVGSSEHEKQEYLDAFFQYKKEMGFIPEDAELDSEDRMPEYRKMDDALPREGKIDIVTKLPFHDSAQNQGGDQVQ